MLVASESIFVTAGDTFTGEGTVCSNPQPMARSGTAGSGRAEAQRYQPRPFQNNSLVAQRNGIAAPSVCNSVLTPRALRYEIFTPSIRRL